MHDRKQVKDAGFTLVETTVALAILGVVLVVSLQAITAYLRTGGTANNLNRAATLGQQKIAELFLARSGGAAAAGSTPQGYEAFTCTANLLSQNSGLAHYAVSVAWDEPGSRKDITVATSIAGRQ